MLIDYQSCGSKIIENMLIYYLNTPLKFDQIKESHYVTSCSSSVLGFLGHYVCMCVVPSLYYAAKNNQEILSVQ